MSNKLIIILAPYVTLYNKLAILHSSLIINFFPSDFVDVVDMISNWRRLELSPVASLPGNLHFYQNIIYHGSPTHPEIGDVRVWFEMAGRTEPGHQDKVNYCSIMESMYCIARKVGGELNLAVWWSILQLPN